jgi:hypothetical protein
MTPTELKARVTRGTSVAALALAAGAAWLAGPAAASGVLAGGALAVVDFRWLAAHATLATRSPSAGAAWLVGAGLRFLVFLAAAGTLLASGATHPVALLVGLTLLPCAVVVQGLRAARQER